MSSFYNDDELRGLGFKSVGHDVKISRKASIYHQERIAIGSHVRIDDFCILSACSEGFISIGCFVHIAAHSMIEASAGVEMHDFSGLACRCTIYGGSDDYGGESLTNPFISSYYRKIIKSKVTLKKHALAGTATVILPGVTMGECSAAGAMSLVMKSIPDGQIYAGIPAKFIKNRSLKLKELEMEFLSKLTCNCRYKYGSDV